jgi:hypothetical protein
MWAILKDDVIVLSVSVSTLFTQQFMSGMLTSRIHNVAVVLIKNSSGKAVIIPESSEMNQRLK